jgi:hypothetical protein
MCPYFDGQKRPWQLLQFEREVLTPDKKAIFHPSKSGQASVVTRDWRLEAPAGVSNDSLARTTGVV